MDAPLESGRIEITVVQDTAGTGTLPRTVTLDVGDIATTEAAGPGSAGARIVLTEEIPDPTPWVFRRDDDEAPAARRELVVRQPLKMVNLLVAWARKNPTRAKPYSEGDYDELFNNPDLVKTKRDIRIGPKASFKKKAGPE